MLRHICLLLAVILCICRVGIAQTEQPERVKLQVVSKFDRSQQPSYLTLPLEMRKRDNTTESIEELIPMVVSLHSWSADLEQRNPKLEKLVADRKWICLQPNFRGRNNQPQALASEAAQQDILDAVDWVVSQYPVDPKRVYLAGSSGGGHMTMMMSAKFPDRWRAASAWVGICDLKQWYELHRDSNYGAMVRKCCEGAPGESQAVDEQYRLRSPKTFLSHAKAVALDLAAGIHDGHKGSVPIHQTLDAFNVIANANGDPRVSLDEIEQLSKVNGRLTHPQASDVGWDVSFNREFYLRRTSRSCRVTIFEGGHEGIASAAMDWFEKHP